MQDHQAHAMTGSYPKFGLELAIDFMIMYFVMYTMIASLDHLYLNIGNAYMTMMMVAPMALLMLFFMRSMYPSRRANLVLALAAVAVFAIGFVGMRSQLAVGDAQFLRSMIPHHSGAILMCERASLTDPEITSLCREIVDAQRREIATMQGILARLRGG